MTRPKVVHKTGDRWYDWYSHKMKHEIKCASMVFYPSTRQSWFWKNVTCKRCLKMKK